MFHMFFLVKYSKSLEEGSFRGRSADFLWMLLFGESLHRPSRLRALCRYTLAELWISVCLVPVASAL